MKDNIKRTTLRLEDAAMCLACYKHFSTPKPDACVSQIKVDQQVIIISFMTENLWN